MTMQSVKFIKLFFNFYLSFSILIFTFSTARAGVISDAPPITQLLYNIFTFLLSVFGFIAIIGLVISGLMYILSAGNESLMQKAKKSAMYSIIGIIVALSGIIIIKVIASILNS